MRKSGRRRQSPFSGLRNKVMTMTLQEVRSKADDKRRFGGNREIVIQRDGERCVECGMTRDEHKEKYGKDIEVNHIDKRGQCVPKDQRNNNLENLETLCRSCHAKKDSPGPHRSFSRKLTLEQIGDIRRMRGSFPARVIAEWYGVSKGAIDQIMIGKYKKKGIKQSL